MAILSDSEDDSELTSSPKALSDLFGKRASRAILVRIVAFAKATPEEHLAPESLLLLGRAILSHPHAESHRESLRSTTGWSDSVQISRLRFCTESTQNRARIEGRIAYCDRPYCRLLFALVVDAVVPPTRSHSVKITVY